MVNFVKPNLLGTRREFSNRFVNPITNGQHSDSTAHDVKVMKRRAHVLHEMLAGFVQVIRFILCYYNIYYINLDQIYILFILDFYCYIITLPADHDYRLSFSVHFISLLNRSFWE